MRDRWWIFGPASYTFPVLPGKCPLGMGYVYGLLFDSGLTKIGKTGNPKSRIIRIDATLSVYGAREVALVGLTHPTPNSALLETRLHQHFADKRIENELFRCSLEEVELALKEVGVPETWSGSIKGKRGRVPEPWYWNSRGAWYAQIKGKQIKLGSTPEKAWDAYVENMASAGRPIELTKEAWAAAIN